MTRHCMLSWTECNKVSCLHVISQYISVFGFHFVIPCMHLRRKGELYFWYQPFCTIVTNIMNHASLSLSLSPLSHTHTRARAHTSSIALLLSLHLAFIVFHCWPCSCLLFSLFISPRVAHDQQCTLCGLNGLQHKIEVVLVQSVDQVCPFFFPRKYQQKKNAVSFFC